MSQKQDLTRERPIRLVNTSLRTLIDRERDNLQKETHFHVRKRKVIAEFLKKEANRHSAAIELPNGVTLEGRQALDYKTQALVQAHNYLCIHYVDELDKKLIFETWSLIEPDIQIKKFRNPDTDGFSFANAMGRTYPRDMHGELDYFIAENNSIDNPLDRALHAHFHIARIHPFLDGNGRLARLIQNVILVDGNYTPIIIDPKDRKDYLDLICKAQNSYDDAERKMTKPQTAFYDFLAMNLFNSLREARKLVEHKTETIKIKYK